MSSVFFLITPFKLKVFIDPHYVTLPDNIRGCWEKWSAGGMSMHLHGSLSPNDLTVVLHL